MLTGFIAISLVSVLVIVITSMITYEILGYVWWLLPRLTIAHRLRVLFMIIPIFAAHIINIWVYALAYFLVEHYMQWGIWSDRSARQAFLMKASWIACIFPPRPTRRLGLAISFLPGICACFPALKCSTGW